MLRLACKWLFCKWYKNLTQSDFPLSESSQFRPRTMSYLHFLWNTGGTTACISHKHCCIWILLTTEVEISVLIHLKSLGKEADTRFLQSLWFGVLKLKHYKGTWLLEYTYHHAWNHMFMFLFIFRLLITPFLRNCSKLYMQGGLVSQALASKLLSHGLLSCQLQVPVHPLSPGSIYWSRKPCGCMQTTAPQHHHTEGMAQSAKARGEGFPSTGILHSLLSQRTVSNTDKIPQWYPNNEVSHISHPAPAPAFISVIFTQSRTLFLPKGLGQDENRRWKHKAHLWPALSTYLLCFKQLHP